MQEIKQTECNRACYKLPRCSLSYVKNNLVLNQTADTMNPEQLNFTTYCVGILAEALGVSEPQAYSLLRGSGVLSDYILPAYDVLHTFGRQYLVEDLTECMREKGVLP